MSSVDAAPSTHMRTASGIASRAGGSVSSAVPAWASASNVPLPQCSVSRPSANVVFVVGQAGSTSVSAPVRATRRKSPAAPASVG